jgi:hypothetical protein
MSDHYFILSSGLNTKNPEVACINVNSSLYITSDRNEVTAADNPTNNDTYEDIEGTTSNQRKKGRKFNIHLHIYKTIIEHNL